MKIVVAIICSGVSFPAMLFERLVPIKPNSISIAFDSTRSWFHNYKNLTTEYVRADAQWWSKCLSFIILVAVIGMAL